MLLFHAPLILTHFFWPASTLLRGHLALATLSLLVNDPQILERWGCADDMVITASTSQQIAFPITVLPKDDRTDFAQEERLGLPYWTMILAICVVVDESKCLDTPILEFSIICEHLPFLPGYKQILHQLLVPRNLAVWR